MWPDIKKVPIVKPQATWLSLLPRTMDRLDAAISFPNARRDRSEYSKEIDAEGFKQDGWLCWASLAALSAVQESLQLDLQALWHSEIWEKSPERAELKNAPLLAGPLELRNYGVHFEVHKSHLRDFTAKVGDRDIEFGQELFFIPVDWHELSKLRNIKMGKSPVTHDMIDWFIR